jgi:hypothetical protein
VLKAKKTSRPAAEVKTPEIPAVKAVITAFHEDPKVKATSELLEQMKSKNYWD